MNELVTQIANILYEKKAQNIVALNVKDLTIITDCMLIATGRSTIQVRTLADEVEEKLTEMGLDPIRKEGHQEGRWIVLDYGEVLVHIFHMEAAESAQFLFHQPLHLPRNDISRTYHIKV